MIRFCNICGGIYNVPPSTLAKGKGKTCSKRCGFAQRTLRRKTSREYQRAWRLKLYREGGQRLRAFQARHRQRAREDYDRRKADGTYRRSGWRRSREAARLEQKQRRILLTKDYCVRLLRAKLPIHTTTKDFPPELVELQREKLRLLRVVHKRKAA